MSAISRTMLDDVVCDILSWIAFSPACVAHKSLEICERRRLRLARVRAAKNSSKEAAHPLPGDRQNERNGLNWPRLGGSSGSRFGAGNPLLLKLGSKIPGELFEHPVRNLLNHSGAKLGEQTY